jgi:uncharacterized membrane protein YphA (DoxX/SURF4 family)
MRIVSGGSLIIYGVEKLQSGQTIESVIFSLFAIGDGVMLIAGLWTPIAGSLTTLLSVWGILFHHDSPYPGILLAAMGAALALVGPGAVSMDAWLFGWKRIDLGK